MKSFLRQRLRTRRKESKSNRNGRKNLKRNEIVQLALLSNDQSHLHAGKKLYIEIQEDCSKSKLRFLDLRRDTPTSAARGKGERRQILREAGESPKTRAVQK